jgi:hypothetical protein
VTHDEIKHAIAEGVMEAFKNPELHCRYRITAERHDEDHILIQQFMRNVGKVSDIKFFVIRWAVIAVLSLVAGLTGFGIVHKIQGG